MRHPVDGITEHFSADFSSCFPATFTKLRLWVTLSLLTLLSGCATFAPNPPQD